MRLLGMQLVVLATLALTSPNAYSACDTTWPRLLPVRHVAETRPFQHTAYRNAREASGKARSLKAALTKALKDGTLDTPEALFGLLDAWNPDASANFLAQWRWRQAHGIDASPRNFSHPYGWANAITVDAGGGTLRDATARPSRALLPTLSVWPPFLTREKQMTLGYPEAAPRTPDELMKLVYSYSTALAVDRLDEVSKKAPLASLPFGKGAWSYPETIARELEVAERHIFQNLKLVSETYPQVALPLAEKDGLWKNQKLQSAWELASRFVIPRYDVFKPFKPTKENFAKFLEDLRHQPKPGQGSYPRLAENADKYRVRASLDWTVDRWRNTLTALVVMNMIKGAINLYDEWQTGELKERWDEWMELPEKFTPEKLQKALNNYGDDPNGFDLVNDHYDKQIAELSAEIEKSGDPGGKRAKKIKELERSREFLAK